jgi:ComF family protein
MVNRIGERILDALFPQHCALCGLRSHTSVPLCRACEQEMPINHSCCTRCAIPLPPAGALSGARVCGNCLQAPPAFDRVIAPWLYEEYFAHLIHRWKFQREQRLTPLLASLWQQHAQLHAPIDALVPVPLHWRRQWQRGFNQAELLCRELHAICPELSSSNVAHRLIRRQRATAAQSAMTARQRASNLRNAFTVCKPCDNLRIAIVDDVLTTGATASAMASALKAAGAGYIEVWCLARTPAPGS